MAQLHYLPPNLSDCFFILLVAVSALGSETLWPYARVGKKEATELRAVFSSGPDVAYHMKNESLSLFTWLPCHERPLPDIGTETWRDPPINQHCCFPQRGCFRGVFDSRIRLHTFRVSQRVKVKMSVYGSHWIDGTVTSTNPLLVRVDGAPKAAAWHHVRPLHVDQVQYDKNITTQVRQFLASQLGVGEGQLSLHADSRRTAVPLTEEQNNALNKKQARKEWHTDYYTAGYVFTALLYVNVHELIGGQTAIADSWDRKDGLKLGIDFDQDAGMHLHRGWIVEPKAGRLLIASGGGENLHAPLPVVKGWRTNFNIWFTCSCSKPMNPSVEKEPEEL